MAWKLENGHLAMHDGNPIWVEEKNGTAVEKPVDAGQLFAKLDEVNGESAERRHKLRELSEQLESFKGLDPVKSRAALDKLADLEKKKLIDAGEVDKVRAEVKAEFETLLAQRDERLGTLRKQLVDGTLSKIFEASPLFAGSTNDKGEKVEPSTFLTPAHAMRIFGEHFDFDEDLKVQPKWPDGRPILSKKNPGEIADPLEALELIVAADPKRNDYTRGTGMSGSGATGNHVPGSPASYDPNAPLAQRVEAIRRGQAPAAA